LGLKFIIEFDEFASNYYLSLKHPIRSIVSKNNDDYFIRLKADTINELLTSEFKNNIQNITIIDVGTGIGLFEKFITGERVSVIGVDLSYRMVHVANSINNNSDNLFCQGDAERLPLPDNSAEIVFSSCVLHHIPNEKRVIVINELLRVCKPDGVVIIFEHNPYNLVTQFVVKTTPLDKNAHLISHKNLQMFANDSSVSYQIVRFFLYGFQNIDDFIKKKFQFISKFPIGAQYYLLIKKNNVHS
jgi:ubiquinone/menaquinone biosynthesis C-methylase UbiE